MRGHDFYRKLTEAVSNGIMKAIDGDEMFDADETELNPIEDDNEDSSVYTNHSKLYIDLLNSDIIERCNAAKISLSFICDNGNEYNVTDDIRNAEHVGRVRFVKFGTDKLRRGKKGIDNSIATSTQWKEHFNRINWLESPYKEKDGGQKWQDESDSITQGIKNEEDAENDFDGYLNTSTLIDIVTKQGEDYKTYIPAVAQAYNATEKLNGKEIHGFLPAMGQLRFMCDNNDLISDVLGLLHVDAIDL